MANNTYTESRLAENNVSVIIQTTGYASLLGKSEVFLLYSSQNNYEALC
jgi:hypothetical protein